jgi:hypothetical protein
MVGAAGGIGEQMLPTEIMGGHRCHGRSHMGRAERDLGAAMPIVCDSECVPIGEAA